MILTVNGEPQDLAVANLAEALVALDFQFVPKRKREETPLREGDAIEIVAPRQGG